MTHGGVPKLVHGDDGDLHDLFSERCLPDERNGVEICEACRGADGEVGCGETCLYERPIFVWMEFEVSMSLKVEYGMQVLSVLHDLGQESVLAGYGGDQDLRQQNVREVPDDVQVPVCGFEMVWRFCVKLLESDELLWSDER